LACPIGTSKDVLLLVPAPSDLQLRRPTKPFGAFFEDLLLEDKDYL
jgi:hypothetical protein